MTDIIDALIPEYKFVRINKVEYCVKKLTFLQICKIGKLASTVTKSLNMEELKGKPEAEMILELMTILGEEHLPILISILVPELKFEEVKNLSTEDISEIILAISEVNNFQKLFSNFQKAFAILTKSLNPMT
jgi:hypothetical protein